MRANAASAYSTASLTRPEYGCCSAQKATMTRIRPASPTRCAIREEPPRSFAPGPCSPVIMAVCASIMRLLSGAIVRAAVQPDRAPPNMAVDSDGRKGAGSHIVETDEERERRVVPADLGQVASGIGGRILVDHDPLASGQLASHVLGIDGGSHLRGG